MDNRFRISHLLTLVAFVAVLFGWWADRRAMNARIQEAHTEMVEAQRISRSLLGAAERTRNQVAEHELDHLRQLAALQKNVMQDCNRYLTDSAGETIDAGLLEGFRAKLRPIEEVEDDWKLRQGL